MATSGSIDFTLTKSEIIEEAFQLIGIGMEGETISAFMSDTASRSLNMMIKTWETKGAKLWAISDATLSLVAGTASYTLTPRPLEVSNVRLSSSSQETPMMPLSREEYFALPDKTSQGIPTQYFYDPGRTTGTLYIWPTSSNATDEIKYNYQRTLEDMDNNTDEPDFPQEWFETITTNLATRLRSKYGRPYDPDLDRRARELESELLAWGQENESIFIGIDYD